MAQPKQRAGSGPDAPKILRIGIIQGEKIVEERLVRKRENVTVGQSARNTFVVPASNSLSRTFTLFELTPQGYALNFTETMDGRISLGDNVVALPALRQAGKAQKKDGLYRPPERQVARQDRHRRRQDPVPVRWRRPRYSRDLSCRRRCVASCCIIFTGCWSR